ncbi:single-stranded DNA-binding protein [Actinoplanes sp. NPDC051861]|uniref:single-stranded DNA-binding protein n=1 Tax=Actinoplanes sp. NPDC051861 TaxID=3155170 RepID=UPI00341788EB
MFDTNIVIVGNVLTTPEWRRTSNSNHLVANFRIASTARRMDRESGKWVDGNCLRVRVTAWRKLAEGVASSVGIGDPVIVYGRLFTRDWTDDEKRPRVAYEMEAYSIGHDLGRGRARFFRNKPAGSLSVVEGVEEDTVVRGETTESVSDAESPVAYGDGLPGGDTPTFPEAVAEIEESADEEEVAVPEEAATERARRSRRGFRQEPVPA